MSALWLASTPLYILDSPSRKRLHLQSTQNLKMTCDKLSHYMFYIQTATQSHKRPISKMLIVLLVCILQGVSKIIQRALIPQPSMSNDQNVYCSKKGIREFHLVAGR